MQTETRIGNIYGFDGGNFAGNVYDKNGISPTISTMQGGGRQPMIVETVKIKQATKKGYAECEIGGVADLSYPDSKTRRGRAQGNGRICPTITASDSEICRIEKRSIPKEMYLSEKGKKYVCDPKRGMCTDINADICQTLTSKGQSNWTGSFVSPNIDRLEKSTLIGNTEPTIIHLKNGDTMTSDDDLSELRIRKLTPREVWRLFHFTDYDFEKAQKVNSNTQLYKQAGNSIVVPCLEAIFRQMNIQGIPTWNEERRKI
jgi:DNA (cytosine-5)-methyltransferase 1